MRREKKEIKQIFKLYGYKPISIEGSWVPCDFMMFRCWLKFVGRDIHLSYSRDIISPKKFQRHSELWSLLFETDMDDGSKESLPDSYREKLTTAYKEAIAEEWKYGLVRIVLLPYRLDEEAKVKSHYSDMLINYSPVISNVAKPVTETILDSMAELFTEAHITGMPCRLLDVYLGQDVKETEIPRIYDMMAEVIDVLNKQQINEFQENKDEEKYQHRDDFDPDNF